MSDETLEYKISETGGVKGTKPNRYYTIPAEALDLVARQFTFGDLKYAPYNYRKGYNWSLSYDALMRHLQAFWSGVDYDEDLDALHLAAAAWHALVLLQMYVEHESYDDRFPFSGNQERKAKIFDRADKAYEQNKAKWANDSE